MTTAGPTVSQPSGPTATAALPAVDIVVDNYNDAR